ncbi:hypothetical protein GCM10009775_10280 [Microbacterium aoyamense]|uniref:protein-tyrosine-phosphatase n=1 Tax=Microbacterium aoyamense TaxID=344166 RepID=A0ABN2PI17_9MICO|nr:low molecular weight phosphatase family protein [Microbacterium aoyamense]
MTRHRSHLSLPVRSPDPEAGVTDILIVCRANRCRSPFAAAIGERLAQDLPIRFHSAGLLGGGHPMPAPGLAVGKRLGYDFSGHLSRELDVYDLDGFDLILAADRGVARDLLAANSDIWPRLFTLKQFSRWIDDHPRSTDAPVGSWLDTAAVGRSRRAMLGADAADDLEDPVVLPAPAWESMADELSSQLREIVNGLETP